MNTLEKRKLETLVVSKLNAARESYTNRRKHEREALISQLEENPPKAVEQIAAKLVQAQAAYKKQKAELDEKAAALGYRVETDYRDEGRISLATTYQDGGHVYTAPQIRSHVGETRERMTKLDDLGTNYAVEIWAENGDMAGLLSRFADDLQKTLA